MLAFLILSIFFSIAFLGNRISNAFMTAGSSIRDGNIGNYNTANGNVTDPLIIGTNGGYGEGNHYVSDNAPAVDNSLWSFTLNSDGNSYTAIGYSGNAESVSVPYSYKGLSVTSVSGRYSTDMGITINPIFNSSNKTTKRVYIPNTITSIGWYTFYGTALTNLYIPSSVVSIGEHSFHNCHSLEEISLPNSIKSLGSDCFHNCDILTKVNIPKDITILDSSTFYGCSKLTSISIPNNVSEIKYACFASSGLISIDIPDSVKIMESHIFYDCQSLINVRLPKDLKILDTYTFAYCSKLPTIVLPEGLTTIKEFSFYECTSLGNIILPWNLELIETSAFNYCTSLTAIRIPDGTNLQENCFRYCTNLTVYINDPHNQYPVDITWYLGCKSGINLYKLPE